MKVVTVDEIPKNPRHAHPTMFTGADAAIQPLFRDSKDFRIGNMNFGKGVRNKWHTHGDEQILIVTAGRGIVATKEEERMVTVGDVILFPAGEVHWHGATEDSEFAHIYVHKRNTVLTQMED